MRIGFTLARNNAKWHRSGYDLRTPILLVALILRDVKTEWFTIRAAVHAPEVEASEQTKAQLRSKSFDLIHYLSAER